MVFPQDAALNHTEVFPAVLIYYFRSISGVPLWANSLGRGMKVLLAHS